MAVRLNETEFWNGEPMEKIKSIHAHYLYDANLVTHICSLQGSYFLHFVGFDFELNEGVVDEDDEIHTWILHGYSVEPQDDYYSSRTIDAIEKGEDKDHRLFMDWEEMKTWAEGYGEKQIIDELHEAYGSNPLW